MADSNKPASGTVHSPGQPSIQTQGVESWKRVMMECLSKASDTTLSIPPETFMLQDQEFCWTALHAVVSIQKVDLEKRTRVFQELMKQRCEDDTAKLLKVQDRDGDTIFHSLINHLPDKNKDVLEMVIKNIPTEITHSLLQVRNNENFTPLERAFKMQKWGFVEVLLLLVMDPNFCILPELTGAQHSPNEPGSPTTTLLHQAFEHAEFAAKYLEIHMRTCKYWEFTDEKIMDSLLVTDQTIHENTPWCYLFDTQRDDDVVIGVLKVLTVFDIQVESLYTDKESQSNLLHPAYKQNRKKLIAFLEEAGIDPKVPNKHGLGAKDRQKSLSIIGLPQDLIPSWNAVNQMMRYELEKALKHGSTLSDITTCLAWGAPGVGKTSVRHYIFGQLPVLLRVSTACMEPAQRGLLASPIEGGEVKCHPVDTQQFKAIVAAEVKVRVEQAIASPLNSSAPSDMSHMSRHSHEAAESGSLVSSGRVNPVSFATRSSTKGESLATSNFGLPVVPEHSVELLPEMEEILHLMETNPDTKMESVQELHWVHFIDSGGQGEFHEILSAFVRNITLLLPVFKLSEKLSDVPTAEYYDHDSKCYELGRFTLTNEELLNQTAQFSFYHQPEIPILNAEAIPAHPKVMVVGTFKDEENKEESIQDKNNRLKESLAPLQEQKLIIPRSQQEIIFPVNATLAGQETEDPVALELRSAIQNHAPRLQIRLPSRWKLLELEVRKLGMKLVKKEKCWEIAQRLGFDSEDGLEAALLYLHETNFFFYDPKVLPGIVFVDLQAIITVITQLFEQCMKLRDAPQAEVTGEEELRFRDQALFTKSRVTSLDIPYDGNLLSSEDVISLLQHKLIAASVSILPSDKEKYYLMPCLLRSLEPAEVARPECTDTSADPLLVTFPTGWAPAGLFCALLVELLSASSPHQWSVPLLYSDPITLLYKNSLELSLAEPGLKGSITLINTARHYEIHPSSQFPTRLLPSVLRQIDSHLQQACSKFSYRVTHKFAFKCQCGATPDHPATIHASKEVVECTKKPEERSPFSAKQRVWLVSTLHVSDSVMPQETFPLTSYGSLNRGPSLQHKYHQGYPGVTFYGSPILESLDSHGGELNFPDLGVKMVVPPNAVPEGEVVNITIWPCLNGPFVLPKGYELTSPVYLITPAFPFEKDVELTLQHFASLTTTDDCDHMTFVSASSSPTFRQGGPEYNFRAVKEGKFQTDSSSATISLRHFCMPAVAREKHVQGENRYSVHFYQTNTERRPGNIAAVLAVSLFSPVYLKNLTDKLGDQLPGLLLWKTDNPSVLLKQPGDEVKVSIQEISDWKVVPDRSPCIISREDMDLPLHSNGASVSDVYPPMIMLQAYVSAVKDPQSVTCHIEVHGFSKDVGFLLLLSKPKEPSTFRGEDHRVLEQQVLSSTCRVLTEDDLPGLQSLLVSVASQSFNIGIQLGLRVGVVQTLEKDAPSSTATLALVLARWLQCKNPPPSVQKLAEVLSGPVIDNKALADKLKRQFV